jgi:hypothetical protein
MAKIKNIFNKPEYLEILNSKNIDVEYVYELYKKEYKRQKEMGNGLQVIRKYFICFIETGDFTNIEDRIDKLRKLNNHVVTLERYILMYGVDRGTKRFNEYREKQAYSNSQEYHNMTDEEFDVFNKSRAVTLENQTKKYGIEEGTKRFNEYREKQAYTNTLQHFIEKHGEIEGKEKYALVKFRKKHTFDSYLYRFGDAAIAEQKLTEYWSNRPCLFTSNIASEFFKIIDDEISDENIESYFHPKNKEFGKYSKTLKKYVLFDYVISKLNLCIEFNGDCFHANPALYKKDDFPNPFQKNLTSEDIWKYDEIKNGELINIGYDIIIIWESDYNRDKEKVINNTIKFIKDRYDEFKRRGRF